MGALQLYSSSFCFILKGRHQTSWSILPFFRDCVAIKGGVRGGPEAGMNEEALARSPNV